MKKITILAAGLLFSIFVQTSAADIKRGEALHAANCVSCHNQGVYTRKDRRITSLDGLRSQVARCETNLDLKLFPEDIDAITDYLNTSYYQFK
jgi:mono/diheme cytochrome c family protein